MEYLRRQQGPFVTLDAHYPERTSHDTQSTDRRRADALEDSSPDLDHPPPLHTLLRQDPIRQSVGRQRSHSQSRYP